MKGRPMKSPFLPSLQFLSSDKTKCPRESILPLKEMCASTLVYHRSTNNVSVIYLSSEIIISQLWIHTQES